jgi:hypothetical protein
MCSFGIPTFYIDPTLCLHNYLTCLIFQINYLHTLFLLEHTLCFDIMSIHPSYLAVSCNTCRSTSFMLLCFVIMTNWTQNTKRMLTMSYHYCRKSYYYTHRIYNYSQLYIEELSSILHMLNIK